MQQYFVKVYSWDQLLLHFAADGVFSAGFDDASACGRGSVLPHRHIYFNHWDIYHEQSWLKIPTFRKRVDFWEVFDDFSRKMIVAPAAQNNAPRILELQSIRDWFHSTHNYLLRIRIAVATVGQFCTTKLRIQPMIEKSQKVGCWYAPSQFTSILQGVYCYTLDATGTLIYLIIALFFCLCTVILQRCTIKSVQRECTSSDYLEW